MKANIVQELKDTFIQHKNPTLALKQSAYMRNQFSFLGISKPELAFLEKAIVKKYLLLDEHQLVAIIHELWQLEEREFHYTALNLAQRYKKLFSPGSFNTFEYLIRTKSWWDTVDTLAIHTIGNLVSTHYSLINIMDNWIQDPCLWIQRSALIFQVRWKLRTDEERLFRYCEYSASDNDFFIRKAIGWALREYSKTNSTAVKEFITKNKHILHSLSIREGLKYTYI